MRNRIAVFLVLVSISIGIIVPVAAKETYPKYKLTGSHVGPHSSTTLLGDADASVIDEPMGGYVFVGGQNGTWFQEGQSPRLDQIFLENNSSVQLNPVRSYGTVWGGGFNGSQFLVSGWGSDDASPGPYIWLYNGAQVVTAGSLDDYGRATSWSGGDIFAASYNGKEWLLSGLGSGPLPSYNPGAVNHMSLGTFNGSAFTDLSSLVPDQQDAILYTNAWNGRYWLVGGGYLDDGVLFTFDGNKAVDLTAQAINEISDFGSVQSIAWNGDRWLIGGVGFLAEYDGLNFVDLTQQLEHALGTDSFFSVNAIAWNGESWMIGGGTPMAVLAQSRAWVAHYSSAGFVGLSSTLPSYISKGNQTSSILAIAAVNGMWIFGGYSGNKGMLLTYGKGSVTDYSDLVSGFTYVDWVSSLQGPAF